MANASTNSIIKLFPTTPQDMPHIPTNGQPPTYASLKIYQQKLDENMMAIDSSTTDLRHLGIVTSNTEFDTLNGSKFIVSTDPGRNTPGPTAAVDLADSAVAIVCVLLFIAVEMLHVFTQQKQEYMLYRTLKKVAHNLLVAAVDDKHISVLNHTRII